MACRTLRSTSNCLLIAVIAFSDTALELIEVQSGAYLEEDDIVRFEDEFNRA